MSRDTNQLIKETLILGMYALKFGYADSNEFDTRRQDAFAYYRGDNFAEYNKEQMVFYALVNTMFSAISDATKERAGK